MPTAATSRSRRQVLPKADAQGSVSALQPIETNRREHRLSIATGIGYLECRATQEVEVVSRLKEVYPGADSCALESQAVYCSRTRGISLAKERGKTRESSVASSLGSVRDEGLKPGGWWNSYENENQRPKWVERLRKW